MAWGASCVVIYENVNYPLLRGFECIFSRILDIATGLAVLTVFIMLTLGGFKYLTSGGEPKATESAQNMLTHAVFGLFLLVIIWLLLKFVGVFTGIPVTNFEIPVSSL